MKKIITLVLAVAMLFAFAGCQSATNETAAEKIVFGTNAEFPPFEFVTANGVLGEYDGIDMAIVKQIGEDIGAEIVIENMESISGMTITDERKETVDFSIPYYKATQVMIVKEDSDIAKAADMEGKKIVAIQGYTGEICVQEMGYEYEAFKKGTEAVMELANGKCDVVVIDSATAESYIKDTEGLKIVEDNEAFPVEEYGIAVQKGNTELLNKINASIEKMLADGKISEWSVQYSEAE